MIELHSNFTIEGSKGVLDGVYGTEHQLHETIEITQGITDWFETGLYIFTSANPNQGGWQWVGDHIRPRVRVPESWHWPVGVSLSLEFGYQRYVFSPDTWTLEFRPIIDKQIGRWYVAFNPVLDRSFHGPSVSQGVVSHQISKLVSTSRNRSMPAWNITAAWVRSETSIRCTNRSSRLCRPWI